MRYGQSDHSIRNTVVGGVAALAVLLGGCACGSRWQYSDGIRVGTITKFSERGAFVKSWEGEMALGGVRAGKDGPVANLWQFTATDPGIIAGLSAAQETGDAVKLHYRQTLTHNPLARDSSYTITGVEMVK